MRQGYLLQLPQSFQNGKLANEYQSLFTTARAYAINDSTLQVQVAAGQVMERLPLGRKRPATVSDLEWHTDAANAAPIHSTQPTTALTDVACDSERVVAPSASSPDQNDSPEAEPQAARFDGSASASGAVLPQQALLAHTVVFRVQSLHHRANQLHIGPMSMHATS